MQTMTNAGTVAYMAPELFEAQPVYSRTSDMYAFGIVANELFCRKKPFVEFQLAVALMDAIKRGAKPELFALDDSSAFASHMSELQVMVQELWGAEAGERPPAASALITLSCMHTALLRSHSESIDTIANGGVNNEISVSTAHVQPFPLPSNGEGTAPSPRASQSTLINSASLKRVLDIANNNEELKKSRPSGGQESDSFSERSTARDPSSLCLNAETEQEEQLQQKNEDGTNAPSVENTWALCTVDEIGKSCRNSLRNKSFILITVCFVLT